MVTGQRLMARIIQLTWIITEWKKMKTEVIKQSKLVIFTKRMIKPDVMF